MTLDISSVSILNYICLAQLLRACVSFGALSRRQRQPASVRRGRRRVLVCVCTDVFSTV